MPLDSRKLSHLSQMVRKSFLGRTQSVTLTLRHPDGTTGAMTVQAVWRPQEDADPALVNSFDRTAAIRGVPDVAAVFLLADVSLAQMRSCINAVPDPIGAEPAGKYLPVSAEIRGLAPGADRLFTRWTRQS